MNILLVGLGGMGVTHFRNYEYVEGARVTAVCGKTDTDRARAAEWGVPMYGSITEACEKAEVDLVDVCVPTWLHKPMVLEAAACGRHIICEKPAALNRADAEEMYAAADRAGVQLYIAQVLQFTKEVEVLRNVTFSGRYGKPLDACFERLSACPGWSEDSWLLDREKSGLLPFDLHIHDLDLIVTLFGKPDEVSYTACGGEKPFREQYRFRYGYRGGPTVCAEAAWFNAAIPFTARWRVYYEHGMLICDEHGVNGYDANGTATAFDVTDPVQVDSGCNLPPTGWFYHELTHLTGCAAKGEPSPLVPRERILDVLGVLESLK